MNQRKSKSIQSKSKDYLTLSIKQEAIRNINFSVADEVYEKDLATREMYKQQRFENGFDDTETWHMDRTIALFIITRLKKFIQVNLKSYRPVHSVISMKALNAPVTLMAYSQL